jgi:hypothetical protein
VFLDPYSVSPTVMPPFPAGPSTAPPREAPLVMPSPAQPHTASTPLESPCAAPPAPPSLAQPRATLASPPSPRAAPPSPAQPRAAPVPPAPPHTAPSSRYTDPIQTYQRRGRRGAPTRSRAEPPAYHPVVVHRDPRHIHPMVTQRAAGVLRAPDCLILSATSSPALPPVPKTVRGALADP